MRRARSRIWSFRPWPSRRWSRTASSTPSRSSRAGGEIRIVARTVEDRFLVEVSDDGPGFAASDMQEGHGLDNLRARLESVFAGDASLRISSEGGRTTVTLSMPRKRVLAQKRVLI